MSSIVEGEFKDNICHQEIGTDPFCSLSNTYRTTPFRDSTEDQHLLDTTQSPEQQVQVMNTLCDNFQHLNVKGPVNQGEGFGEAGEHAPMSEHVCDDFETPGAEDHDTRRNLSHSEQEIIDTSTRHTTSQFQGARDFTICRSHIENNRVKNEYYFGNHDKTCGISTLKEFVSFDAIHDSCARDPTRQIHPGTRQRTLKSIRDWIDTPDVKDRIFWLHGPAGAGKSAIAQEIAHTNAREKLLATFFFFRSDSSRNNGNRLFATLAWQFALSIPAIREALIHSLIERPDIPTKDVETQFKELIVIPFLTLKTRNIQPSAPVVIIDGVDECSDDRLQRRFLKIIGDAVNDSHFPVRFLICSRPEAHIQDTMNKFESITLSLDLAELDDANQDIEKYLKDEFDRIATEQEIDPSWPGERTIEDLVYQASGQFIYASTVIKFVEDEYNIAQSQLKIIMGLKPCSNVSPFAELDKLYTGILSRQRDRNFLKEFLSLLIARSGFRSGKYYKDDALLMNVSQKELGRKLRGMRSLLKFEPYIDVHHRSFLDFLQDASRSGQYYINKEAATRRYLDLIVDALVRNTKSMIERQEHENHLEPEFSHLLKSYPPDIVLPAEEWQEALKPVLDSWNKLLALQGLSYIRQPARCFGFKTLRNLMLHHAIITGASDVVHDFSLVMGEYRAKGSAGTVIPLISNETEPNVLEKDLDGCLSSLLPRLQKRKLGTSLDTDVTQLMCFLLRFDHVEIVMRLCSISDAQSLMDLIDELINNFYNDRDSDNSWRAAHLGLELYARIPVLPRSLFLKGTFELSRHHWEYLYTKLIDETLKTVIASKILDPNYVLRVLWIRTEDKISLVGNKRDENTKKWEEWINDFGLNAVNRIRIMLEVAKAIRYLHSLGLIVFRLHLQNIILDSKLQARIKFTDFNPQYISLKPLLKPISPDDYKIDIEYFGHLFEELCNNCLVFVDFNGKWTQDSKTNISDEEWELIRRCRHKHREARPTIEEIIGELEAYNA